MNELPPDHPGRLETPFEKITVSETLPSHLVDPNRPRAIAGYELAADLMQHYDFGEVIFLTMTGELPSREAGRAFNTILMTFAPVAASEADANCAIISSVVRADDASRAAASSLTATEVAREIVERYEPWREWLATRDSAETPDTWQADSSEAEDAAALAASLERLGFEVPSGAGWLATAFAGLWQLGIREPQQWLTLVMLSRLPAALAEGTKSHLSLGEYPNTIPRYRYVHSRR